MFYATFHNVAGNISYKFCHATEEVESSSVVKTYSRCGKDIVVWRGFVWMNAPFGERNGLLPWLEKFFEHGNGIALVPDHTSAPWWQQFAPRSELALFVAKKIKFIGADGKPGKSPAQGTCLLASGRRAIEPLCRARAEQLGVLMRPEP